jgi:hypothetical protein
MGIVYTNKNLTTTEKDFQWEEGLDMNTLELNADEKNALDQGLEEPNSQTIQSILSYSKTTEFSATQAGDFKGNKN